MKIDEQGLFVSLTTLLLVLALMALYIVSAMLHD